MAIHAAKHSDDANPSRAPRSGFEANTAKPTAAPMAIQPAKKSLLADFSLANLPAAAHATWRHRAKSAKRKEGVMAAV
jgi:hypothetical protein